MIAAKTQPAGLDFDLPPELVAQRPASVRDACRLLCARRDAPGALEECRFDALVERLRPGDLLVRNVSRVLPARLRGERAGGGAAEFLLIEPDPAGGWWALARPGRRLGRGARVRIGGAVWLAVADVDASGRRRVTCAESDLADVARQYGTMPLPPYIARSADARDDGDYQTVYAREPGSVAAPTAGLHFTPELLARIAAAGVGTADIVLHVGLGTFAPLRPADLGNATLHSERFAIGAADLAAIDAARARGGRIVAVGTTVVRTLESLWRWRRGDLADVDAVQDEAGVRGRTQIFLRPPAAVEAVDALVTNFHLPRTSLILLVQAFAGAEVIRQAYRHAVAARFRFYSYGDAMWIE